MREPPQDPHSSDEHLGFGEVGDDEPTLAQSGPNTRVLKDLPRRPQATSRRFAAVAEEQLITVPRAPVDYGSASPRETPAAPAPPAPSAPPASPALTPPEAAMAPSGRPRRRTPLQAAPRSRAFTGPVPLPTTAREQADAAREQEDEETGRHQPGVRPLAPLSVPGLRPQKFGWAGGKRSESVAVELDFDSVDDEPQSAHGQRRPIIDEAPSQPLKPLQRRPPTAELEALARQKRRRLILWLVSGALLFAGAAVGLVALLG